MLMAMNAVHTISIFSLMRVICKDDNQDGDVNKNGLRTLLLLWLMQTMRTSAVRGLMFIWYRA